MAQIAVPVALGVGLPVCALGGAFLAYTAYVAYVHRKYSHIPSPRRSNFYLGHLTDLFRFRRETGKEDAFFRLVNYWLQGVDSETFIVFFFHAPMVVTVDPTFIKTIYANQRNVKTSTYKRVFHFIFGARFMEKALFVMPKYEPWLPVRELYNPGFSQQFLTTIVTSMNESLDSTLDKMVPLADGTTKVPMRKHLKKLTLDVISQSLFSTDFGSVWTAESLGVTLPPETDVDIMTHASAVSLNGVQKNAEAIIPALNRFLHPFEARRHRSSLSALRTIGRECFRKRMKMIENNEELPKDGLTQMLLANREDFDIDQFQDQFCNFFPLGYEPLSNAIQFTFILLHQHPNVLERVRQEMEEVLGSRTRITNEDLEAMKYLEKVFYESLRLYYVAPGTTRKLHATTMVGEYSIPAGMYTMIAETNMFHMAKYFTDPDQFMPDRFDNETIPSLTFFPFGQGPRSCIGKYLLVMTAKMVLVRLLQTFKINFPEDYEIYIARDPAVRPRDDFICTLQLNQKN